MTPSKGSATPRTEREDAGTLPSQHLPAERTETFARRIAKECAFRSICPGGHGDADEIEWAILHVIEKCARAAEKAYRQPDAPRETEGGEAKLRHAVAQIRKLASTSALPGGQVEGKEPKSDSPDGGRP